MDESTKNEIRSKLSEYVSLITKPSPKAGKDMFVCPICGSGSHGGRKSDGAFHVTGDQWYCHSCQNGGDIFTLYAELNHLDLKRDFPQIIEGLSQALGVIIENTSHTPDWYGWDWNDLVQDDHQPDQEDNEPEEKDLRQELEEIEKSIRDLWQRRTDLNNDQWKNNQEELSRIHGDLIAKGLRRQEIINLLNESSANSKPEEEEKPMNQERIDQINKYASQLKGSPAESYLKGRGFSDEIIARYKLGYNAQSGRVVIPYPGTDYKIERAINDQAEKKYLYPKGEEIPIFKIKGSEKDFYFITEGQLDALSIIQSGAKNVIALGGGSYHLIEDEQIAGAVIVGDRDPDDKRGKDGLTPGERTAKKISETLSKRNIRSLIIYPPDGYKDSNDLLKDNPSLLTQFISQFGNELLQLIENEQQEQQPTEEPADQTKKRNKVINVSDYLLENIYDQDIEYFRQYRDRKIGFGNIDKYMTLYPGVCCLGGASSLGKTTFAVNIVDNLLEKGESVIYFALEQLPIELITKSLARRMHYIDPASTLTNIDIKNGAVSSALTRARNEYIQTARNYTIVEGDFHVTVDHIVKYVEAYIEATSVKPIVVIDYLQLIAPPDGFKGTQREIIDENLKAIKDLSKRNELFILLISSFNRASYKEPVSMESFKESGMIEYTCDYILGLQLSILEDSSFYTSPGARGGEKDNNNDKKEKKLYDAMNQSPKEVELVCLKNRNGRQRFKCFFQYEMKYDTFTPDFNSKYDPESAKADFDDLVKSFDQLKFKEV